MEMLYTALGTAIARNSALIQKGLSACDCDVGVAQLRFIVGVALNKPFKESREWQRSRSLQLLQEYRSNLAECGRMADMGPVTVSLTDEHLKAF